MSKSLPPIPANPAFFIDFDGTLVAIAQRPDLVEVEPAVRHVLESLQSQFDGAVAVVTGRPLDVADNFLDPLKLPVAAEHGSVRRDAAGRVHVDRRGVGSVKRASARLAPLVEANPGLLLEPKLTSVALHYRQRPELAEICRAAVEAAAAGVAGLAILSGKMIYELRPEGVDKGTAVATFLTERPFAGRAPVYAGDDVTDEHAFAVVNGLGGITIKVGDGDTAAQYRIDRKGLFAWLKRAAADGESS